MSRWGVPAFLVASVMFASGAGAQGAHDALVAKHAAAYGVPESLVRRVIRIESHGNPRLVSKGNYGLMQIRLGTARAMGYTGTARGLLDADTNMTYAVKYLAGAYRAAGCNAGRAIAYYQRGYHRVAKRRCSSPSQIEVVGLRSDVARPAQGVEKPESKSASAPPAAAPPAPASVQAPDVLRPRVVRTLAISRPGHERMRARTVARLEPEAVTAPLPRARPSGGLTPPASQVEQSPDTTQAIAAREPEAVPMPPVKQPDLRPPTKPKVHAVHRSSHRRAHAKKKADAPLNVLAFIKRLIEPAKTEHVRKRRSHVQR
jgi:Transglycosylase SLT domain